MSKVEKRRKKGEKKVMDTEVRGRGWTKRQKKGNGRCWSHQLEALGGGQGFSVWWVPGSQFGAASNQGLVMCISFFVANLGVLCSMEG